jgi:hypothetical protein
MFTSLNSIHSINKFNKITTGTGPQPVTDIDAYFVGDTLKEVDFQSFTENRAVFTYGGTIRGISVSYNGQYVLISTNSNTNSVSSNYGTTWRAITGILTIQYNYNAMSYLGQYMLLTSQGNNNYRSSNYGVTWTVISPAFPSAGYCAVSYSGQYMLLTTNGTAFGVMVSNNYGVSWAITTQNGPSGVGCSMSYSGQYMLAVQNILNNVTYYSWLSTNYGVSWSIINSISTTDAAKRFFCCSVSKSGAYQLIGCASGILLNSSNYGTTWQTTNTLNTTLVFRDCKIAFNPRYQVATGSGSNATGSAIYYTTNYGFNWNGVSHYAYNTTLNGGFNNIAISQNMQYIYTGVGGSGGAWIHIDPISEYIGYNNFADIAWTNVSSIVKGRSLATSYNGQYTIISTIDNGVRLSSNYGITFVQYAAATFPTTGVTYTYSCMAYDAKCIYIARDNSTLLYKSSNFGILWTTTTVTGLLNPRMISTNYTGKYVSIAHNTGIFASTNAGVTFTSRATTPVTGISMSFSGQYQLAVSSILNASNYSVYRSTNYGFTFGLVSSLQSTTTPYNGVAISRYGDIQLIGGNGCGIIYSSNYGSTWTNSTSSPSINGQYVYDIKMTLDASYVLCSASSGSAGATNSGVWYSTNAGQYWQITPTNPGSGTTTAAFITMSQNGKYKYFVNTTLTRQNITPSFNGNPYRISIGGIDTEIINTNNKRFWGFCGGIGPNLILTCYNDNASGAAPYFFSSNNGTTWTEPTVPHNRVSPYANYRQAWVSFNGIHRIIVNNSVNVYVSSNSGVNWTASNPSDARYQGCYVSEDGNLKLTSNNNSYIYRLHYQPTTTTFALASTTGVYTSRGMLWGSGSGQYIIGYTGALVADVPFSTDYAATWVNIAGRLSGFGNTAGPLASISFTGQYIYLATGGYKLWRSADYGTTFSPIHGTGGLLDTTTYTSNNAYQLQVSYSGQYCVCSAYIDQGTTYAAPNAYTFVSRDYGITWSSPKLIPLTNPAINPSMGQGTMTHSSDGVPIRSIITCYSAGIFYLDF